MKRPYLLSALALLVPVSAPAAPSLEDAIAKLDREPAKADVSVTLTGIVTGLAETEDLVVASDRRIVVVDLPPATKASEFPIGTVIQVRGELERAPKWASFGAQFEVDAKSVSHADKSPTKAAAASKKEKPALAPGLLGLDEAVAILRDNRRMDDIPVSFNAVVTAWHEEDEMTVDAAGTRVRVDIPYGLHAISFPVGSSVSITGTLDRRPRMLPGPRYEVYARTLTLREQSPAS
jgi:hypothetical protein